MSPTSSPRWKPTPVSRPQPWCTPRTSQTSSTEPPCSKSSTMARSSMATSPTDRTMTATSTTTAASSPTRTTSIPGLITTAIVTLFPPPPWPALPCSARCPDPAIEEIPFTGVGRVRAGAESQSWLTKAKIGVEVFWFRHRRSLGSSAAVLGVVAIAGLAFLTIAREIQSSETEAEGTPFTPTSVTTLPIFAPPSDAARTGATFPSDLPETSTTKAPVRRSTTSSTEAPAAPDHREAAEHRGPLNRCVADDGPADNGKASNHGGHNPQDHQSAADHDPSDHYPEGYNDPQGDNHP